MTQHYGFLTHSDLCTFKSELSSVACNLQLKCTKMFIFVCIKAALQELPRTSADAVTGQAFLNP